MDLQTESEVVGRLAPSPTGALHLGNARSFLLAWLSVRIRHGALLCRIEDLDGPRIKPESIQEALEDLEWLGLDYDGEPRLQSPGLDRYNLALAHLESKGLIYPCICTRSEIERAQSAPQESLDHGLVYPGTCRDRYESGEQAKAESGIDPAWRFRLPDDALISFEDGMHGLVEIDVATDCGDFVVAKKDGQPAYQLAVVVDDGDSCINEVLRGDDLLSSTSRQILLYRALGFPEPRWIHVPLVLGPDGRRLAKRHGDTRLSQYRRRGIRPGEILGYLAFSAGLLDSPRELSAIDLLDFYDLAKLTKTPFTLTDPPW
jgi:glutamyl-tRNA synthetase